jgi:hypothetical protein
VRLRNIDRLIFVWLYRFFPSILSAITVVKPETVIRWIAGQVTDAFPWDEAPRHLIRDRDGAFGPAYTRRIRAMGILDHPTAPHSQWQNGHVERLIGSIVANLSTTSSCSAKPTCAISSRPTLRNTTRSGRIFH